jgi:hypothetical protein
LAEAAAGSGHDGDATAHVVSPSVGVLEPPFAHAT